VWFKPFPGNPVKYVMGGVARVKSWNAANTGHDEEQNLVGLAMGGDLAAFESLYRRHRDRVHGLVWRLCGCDPALAQDLLQDTFVRAWSKLHLFRGESLFGTWLHRMAVNVALSDRRIRVRRARFESALDETAERTAVGHRDVHAADHRDLERAIARLPERARTVLVLFDIEGYGHAEIADITGMAEGSSKAQLHRARKLLREELGE
jgi:RNA polymerase sigma-70 factor (ECF subfamily)